MSISMHIDEYMARRGITPDDTVVVDDPCAVFDGAVEKAGQLAHYYAAVAQRQQVHFADAAGCPMNTVDYMHLTREGHAMLARRLSRLVPDLV